MKGNLFGKSNQKLIDKNKMILIKLYKNKPLYNLNKLIPNLNHLSYT